MSDGRSYTIETREVLRRGTLCKMRVGQLPWGDFFQLYPLSMSIKMPKTQEIAEVRFPRGTLWRNNEELYHRTKGKTSHMCVPDLYALECMGRHIVTRYGLGKVDQTSEASQLREDVGTARTYAEYALMTGAYTDEDRPVFEALIRKLVVVHARVRDPHKMTARERFIRGMVLTDRLGRFNPMASALVTGSGIGHLLERQADVKSISLVVDRKTLFVFEYIRRHIELYQELWDTLRLSAKGEKRNKLQRLLESCEVAGGGAKQAVLRTRAWLSIQILLTGYFAAFHRIDVRPFSKNALHTRRDLRDAMGYAHEENATGLRTQIAKIRQGISWVFALDFLHRNVLAGLRFTLERLRREVAHQRRGTGQRGRLKITRSLAPASFADVDARLASFVERVEKCSDADLKVKVKDRVLAYARAAQAAMTREEWLVAKRQLVLAAGLL